MGETGFGQVEKKGLSKNDVGDFLSD